MLNSSDGGKLNIQLRNKRAAIKRQHVVEPDNILTDDEAKEMVEVLKTTVVNNQNIDSIKDMLKSTLKYRTKMLKDEQLNLREYFPYFWVSKELVSINIRYYLICFVIVIQFTDLIRILSALSARAKGYIFQPLE